MTQPRDVSFADGKILCRHAGPVATLTFNHPEKRNAMTLAMWEGFGDAMSHLVADAETRVVVLTGAGDKAFVSGADISQFEALRHDARTTQDYGERSSRGRDALATCPKPTIASIRGYCIGGGLLLAMLADIRIASEGSQFGIPAAKLGVSYGLQGLDALVALVGPSRARLLMYTAERIGSDEALRIGLIDRCVAEADLAAATDALARTIAGNAPLSIKAAKTTIAELQKDPSVRDLESVARLDAACADSEDFREGRRAFVEKRAPRFSGT